MVRIGIIGSGRIAERHLQAYKKLKRADVIISDIDGDKAKDTSRRFQIGFMENPEQLIESPDIDAVDICTPTVYHKEVIVKALGNRKHVFCEKPLCQNLAEALEIREAVEKVDRVIMVGYLYRYHPAFQFVKQVLEDKIIGDPHFAIFRLGGRGSHKAWKHQKDKGGGVVLEMLVHKLDLITWFFGDVKLAETMREDLILPRRLIDGQMIEVDAEDFILLRLQADRAQIVCESDLVTPSYMEYIEIHGDNGSLFSSILNFLPTVVYCEKESGIFQSGNNFYQFPTVNLFERELEYFLSTIEGGELETNSIDNAISIMRIVEQIGGA